MNKLTGKDLSSRLNRFGAGKSMQAGNIKRGAGKVLSTLALAGLLFAATPGSAQAVDFRDYSKDRAASERGHCVYKARNGHNRIEIMADSKVVREWVGKDQSYFRIYDFVTETITTGQTGNRKATEPRLFSELGEAAQGEIAQRRQWVEDCANRRL